MTLRGLRSGTKLREVIREVVDKFASAYLTTVAVIEDRFRSMQRDASVRHNSRIPCPDGMSIDRDQRRLAETSEAFAELRTIESVHVLDGTTQYAQVLA